MSEKKYKVKITIFRTDSMTRYVDMELWSCWNCDKNLMEPKGGHPYMCYKCIDNLKGPDGTITWEPIKSGPTQSLEERQENYWASKKRQFQNEQQKQRDRDIKHWENLRKYFNYDNAQINEFMDAVVRHYTKKEKDK